MNDKYPSFAAEERNIRLRLSTDGFNPFNMKNSNYSCWHVLLVNYNLPPHLCMKKENIMLTLLIPGPQQPGNNIDVYLEPLIKDLNYLWKNGELLSLSLLCLIGRYDYSFSRFNSFYMFKYDTSITLKYMYVYIVGSTGKA